MGIVGAIIGVVLGMVLGMVLAGVLALVVPMLAYNPFILLLFVVGGGFFGYRFVKKLW